MMPFNGNPQQMVMMLMQQNMQNNPMFTNLLALANQGKTADIETIAKKIILILIKSSQISDEILDFKYIL